METVKIVTDSGANLPPEVAGELGIEIIPFLLTLNARSFKEGVDITAENFYKRRDLYHAMAWESPAYHDYALAYMRVVKENKRVLFFHSTAALSPMAATAQAVHNDFRASHGTKAVILDSGTWGMGLTLAVTSLAMAAANGLPFHRLITLAVKIRQESGYIMGVGNAKLLAEAYRPRGLAALTSKAAYFSFDRNGVPAPYKKLAAKKGRMVLDLVQHIKEQVGDDEVITGVEGTDGERLYGSLSGAVTECFNCAACHTALARPSLSMSFGPDFFALSYVKSKTIAPFTEKSPPETAAA